jgi:hypothetical protein
MSSSSISFPLLLGIAGTIAFDFLPIVFGYEMTMNLFFILYAVGMLILSFMDRRVLGYATVLSACNAANALSLMQYSFLMAIITIIREYAMVGQLIFRDFSNRKWWWLFLAAFLCIGLSIPFWPMEPRAMLIEVKNALSRLGYVVLFPLAVGATLRNPRDGVRAVSLLCMTATAIFMLFYVKGEAGAVVQTATKGAETLGVFQYVGAVWLNFNRTLICIPLASLAAAGIALGVGAGFRPQALIVYLCAAVCLFLIMQMASTGSALAMVCGMGVVFIGYFSGRLSLSRLFFGSMVFTLLGTGLFWAVFQTENSLAKRLETKIQEVDTSGIDRMGYWQQGLAEIAITPLGEGWSYRTGHSDWLLYLLSYGWLAGTLYLLAAGWLFIWMALALRRHSISTERSTGTLLLVGLAALTVYAINGIFDMESVNIGYYAITWTLVMTSASVVTVAKAAESSTRTASVSTPMSAGMQFRRL